MEQIISLTSIILSLALSGRHVSGFSFSSPSPSGASVSFPLPLVVGRHHKHHVNVVTSSIQLMASTSSSGSSVSSDGIISELAASPNSNENETILSKAPSLNGKIVLPVKVMTAGLRGHRVAAVYAILSSNYKRGLGGDGWEHVVHIGITKDLARDISYFTSQKGSEAVSHVRALSFSYPQKAIMEEFANGWRRKVVEAQQQQQQQQQQGGQRMMGDDNDNNFGWGMVPLNQDVDVISTDANNSVGSKFAVDDDDDDEEEDDDDDMDEDDLDDYLQMMAVSRAAVSSSPSTAAAAAATTVASPPLFVDNTGLTNIMSLKNRNEMPDVISPFDNNNNDDNAMTSTKQSSSPIDDGELLELGIENVDKVLDEVRPYLISDGGNVCVQNVDLETGNVYLLLEGACGSCASSTVTMKMGIERVLKEKFGDRLGEVIQVEPGGGGEGGGGGKPSELTIEAVQAEVNRMSAAITAMGGVVRVVSVDPIGVVEIEFRGPNRVKKGLELALLDVEFVKHVKFVS